MTELARIDLWFTGDVAPALVLWAGIEVGLMASVLAITALLVTRVPPA